MNWKLTLILGGSLSLAACGAYQVEKTSPTSPTLNPIKLDGLVCFTDNDAVKLGAYIIELEAK
jgi:hypothetical protein